MMTDPIADMLTRIRNAARRGMPSWPVPSSKHEARGRARAGRTRASSATCASRRSDGRASLVLRMRYDADGRPMIDGMRRVSRPGRRVYVGKAEIPRVRNGLGMAVLSTSKGILSDRAAREAEVGGELLCEVW